MRRSFGLGSSLLGQSARWARGIAGIHARAAQTHSTGLGRFWLWEHGFLIFGAMSGVGARGECELVVD